MLVVSTGFPASSTSVSYTHLSDGQVDLGEKELRNMDVVIASLHLPCMKPGSRAENTEAYLNVMKNPYVNIIGHPDDGRYEIDYPALVQGARCV